MINLRLTSKKTLTDNFTTRIFLRLAVGVGERGVLLRNACSHRAAYQVQFVVPRTIAAGLRFVHLKQDNTDPK